MTILLTGFEPNDRSLNASQILVESLAKNLPESLTKYSDLIHCEIMPGDTNKLDSILSDRIDFYQPKFCVFVGQAPGRNKISIERIATNLKDFNSSDRAGNLPKNESIEKDGPVAYWSNLPHLETIIEKLNNANIPAAFSNYAGNHLCNQILYQGLHYATIDRLDLKCGFVHIPPLPIQVKTQWEQSPFMTLDMTRNALEIILSELFEPEITKAKLDR